MITAVLGAPGSGKSTLARLLIPLLPGHAVLDWDSFMEPAAALAGRDIRQDPGSWPAYRQLVRAVVDAVAHLPAVLFTVCTPDELAGWPIGAWLLLDCTDEERRLRLGGQGRAGQAGQAGQPGEAVLDAREYRAPGLPALDTTGRAPEDAAVSLVQLIQGVAPGRP